MVLTSILLGKIANKAKKNGVKYYKLAQEFATKGEYGLAYSFLVFSLEEIAKYHVCWMRQIALDSVGKPPGQHPVLTDISDEKVRSIFREHTSKRVTELTQLILPMSITNDIEQKKRITQAILQADYTLSDEVKNVLAVYHKIDSLRNKGLYVERDGTSPKEFKKEDYDELFQLVEPMNFGDYESSSGYGRFRNFSYMTTEKNIASMLKEFKKNETFLSNRVL